MKYQDRWLPLAFAVSAARKLKELARRLSGSTPEKQAPSKSQYLALASTSLGLFLSERHRLALPSAREPVVTIVLVLFNRAPLTYLCLQSIRENAGIPSEVVIVDNASTDETGAVLDRLDGAHILRNDENHHFLRACNQGAAKARGKYLLLLNNDAKLQPGAVEAAVATIAGASDIAAVGARIVLTDGTLQEAGSIVWRDGICAGYGRGDRPDAPPYMFRRDVDYASGAFLLVRRELFDELGGLDEAFAPAYYEEVDFCLRARALGFRTVYEPASVIIHYEFASSRDQNTALALQSKNRGVFVERHPDLQREREAIRSERVLFARATDSPRSRVLFVEDRVPHPALGRGYPRSHQMLLELVRRGHFVTLYPLIFPLETWGEVYSDVPRVVEVMNGYGSARLKTFLQERRGYYDTVVICRPHNMEIFLSAAPKDWLEGVRMVYDAEAVFAMREVAQKKLTGEVVSPERVRKLAASEMSLARKADVILTVCERERRVFEEHGIENTAILGHTITLGATGSGSGFGFVEREHFLFAGAMPDDSCPNAESMVWFIEEVLPLLRSKLETPVRLWVAGVNEAPRVLALASPSVQMLGLVEDLEPLYARSRVFVAPTRFGAGIPLKVYEAAARGLPVAASRFVAEELSWRNEVDLLAADETDAGAFADACARLYTDEALWTAIRESALERTRNECSGEAFGKTVEAAFE